jgi:hypothetical protein
MFDFITDLPSGLDGFESDFDSAFSASNLLHTARSQSDNSNLSNSHHGVMVRRIIHAMSLSNLMQRLKSLHHYLHGLVRHGWASLHKYPLFFLFAAMFAITSRKTNASIWHFQ